MSTNWCTDYLHDFVDADDLRQRCAKCPSWRWKPGCSPQELYAQIQVLQSQLEKSNGRIDALEGAMNPQDVCALRLT